MASMQTTLDGMIVTNERPSERPVKEYAKRRKTTTLLGPRDPNQPCGRPCGMYPGETSEDEAHREKYRAYNRKYRARDRNDPEHERKRRERYRQRYRENFNGMRDKTYERNKTAAYRYALSKVQAKRRGLEFAISRSEYETFLYADACFYCGTKRGEDERLGVDRYDNGVGYVLDNCRASCIVCNKMKLTYDVRLFIERCHFVHGVAINGPPRLTPEQCDALPFDRCTLKMSHIIGGYKSASKKRGRPFELTKEQFARLVYAPCHYCWSARSGVDRVDSSMGYVTSNCVPCCQMCNKMKLAHTTEVFLLQCARVAHNHPRASE